MSYQALLKKAWKLGEFFLSETEAGQADSTVAQKRPEVEAEMVEIAQREAWDANACLTAHREGIMKLAPFVKFREEKFGAVLFETRSEKVYTLSQTGAAVVREVIAGADAKTLIDNLKVKYEDTTGRMAIEAAAFLATLREKGLVTE
jgi:hypothetical protein